MGVKTGGERRCLTQHAGGWSLVRPLPALQIGLPPIGSSFFFSSFLIWIPPKQGLWWNQPQRLLGVAVATSLRFLPRARGRVVPDNFTGQASLWCSRPPSEHFYPKDLEDGGRGSGSCRVYFKDQVPAPSQPGLPRDTVWSYFFYFAKGFPMAAQYRLQSYCGSNRYVC